MRYVVKIEPYKGDSSELSTCFWPGPGEAPEEGPQDFDFEYDEPMWAIVDVEDGKAEIIDYGYRTEADARRVL